MRVRSSFTTKTFVVLKRTCWVEKLAPKPMPVVEYELNGSFPRFGIPRYVATFGMFGSEGEPTNLNSCDQETRVELKKVGENVCDQDPTTLRLWFVPRTQFRGPLSGGMVVGPPALTLRTLSWPTETRPNNWSRSLRRWSMRLVTM